MQTGLFLSSGRMLSSFLSRTIPSCAALSDIFSLFIMNRPLLGRLPRRAALSLSVNLKSGCVAAFTPHFVFSATGAAKKHFISEKLLNMQFFKNTGVVSAGIECSPKIKDFRANGIPVRESAEISALSELPRRAALFNF